MTLSQVCSRFKVLILSVIGIFRRALCCFSRRRKSLSSENENLETISVIKEYNTPHQIQMDRNQKYPKNEKDWNSWDDSPRTVEEHIEHYRQRLARPPTPKDSEPEPDFFQDMTPKIKPQPMLYVKQENQQQTDFSRLEAKVDIPIAISPDLEDWTEDGVGGWEELNTDATKQLIREKRKELRTQRQQQNKIKDGGIQKTQQLFAERITIKQS